MYRPRLAHAHTDIHNHMHVNTAMPYKHSNSPCQKLALAILMLMIYSALLCAPDKALSSELYGVPSPNYSAFFTDTQLDLNAIQALPDSKWQVMPEGLHHVPYFDSAASHLNDDTVLWLKVELPRRSSEQSLWLELSPNVGLDGRIAQYKDERWQWYHPEGREPRSSGTYPVNHLTFELDLTSTKKLAYIKVNSSLVYHFKIISYTQSEFAWHTAITNIFNGFVLGFLCLAIIYNLVIGVSATERIYLYYAFYVFCSAIYLMVISGYLRLMFPEWGGMGSMTNLAAALEVLAALIFTRAFLATKKYAPSVDKALKFMQILAFIILISVSFVDHGLAVSATLFMGMTTSVAILYAGIKAQRAGASYAKYFLVAWLAFLPAILLWSAMWLGIISAEPIILELFKLGSLVQITLLSAVLAFRYSFLKDQTEQLSQAKIAFKTLSETDDLTGVYNRRGFLKRAEELVHEKNDNCIWLALDVDHFKQFNDTHGHIAGDHLLAEFGNILNTNQRREDLAAKLISEHSNSHYRRAIAGRLGGEEFAVMLTDCSIAQARLYAERLMEEFRNLLVDNKHGRKVGTTLSIGAAKVQLGDSLESTWKRADNYLYMAKKNGRDQVVTE